MKTIKINGKNDENVNVNDNDKVQAILHSVAFGCTKKDNNNNIVHDISATLSKSYLGFDSDAYTHQLHARVNFVPFHARNMVNRWWKVSLRPIAIDGAVSRAFEFVSVFSSFMFFSTLTTWIHEI